jgi:hypothetical protein
MIVDLLKYGFETNFPWFWFKLSGARILEPKGHVKANILQHFELNSTLILTCLI